MTLLGLLIYRDLVQFAEPVDEPDTELEYDGEPFDEWEDCGEPVG